MLAHRENGCIFWSGHPDHGLGTITIGRPPAENSIPATIPQWNNGITINVTSFSSALTNSGFGKH
jgi:hypothetical protein